MNSHGGSETQENSEPRGNQRRGRQLGNVRDNRRGQSQGSTRDRSYWLLPNHSQGQGGQWRQISSYQQVGYQTPGDWYFHQQRFSRFCQVQQEYRVTGYRALGTQFVYFDCLTSSPVSVTVTCDGTMNGQGAGGVQGNGWGGSGGNHDAWNHPGLQSVSPHGRVQPGSGFQQIFYGTNTFNLNFGSSGQYSVNLNAQGLMESTGQPLGHQHQQYLTHSTAPMGPSGAVVPSSAQPGYSPGGRAHAGFGHGYCPANNGGYYGSTHPNNLGGHEMGFRNHGQHHLANHQGGFSSQHGGISSQQGGFARFARHDSNSSFGGVARNAEVGDFEDDDDNILSQNSNKSAPPCMGGNRGPF